VTDSTSDLPLLSAKQNGIEIVPLSVVHRGKAYLDGIEITPDTFYPLLQDQEELPKTSQPTPLQFSQLYETLLQKYDHVISIHISAGLSSTVEAARSVAKSFSPERLHVVDSGFLSYALAFEALEASRMASAGATVKEILDTVARIKSTMELVFTLDTLHYLHKGGRIGKVSSLLGNLLNIKPVIRVDNGVYIPAGRARSQKQALLSIVQYMSDRFKGVKVKVAVGQGRAQAAADFLKEQLCQALSVSGEPHTFEVGPVIGVHTGPGTVGCAVYPVT